MATEFELIFNVGVALSTAVITIIWYILSNRTRKRTAEKTSEKIDRLSNLLKNAGSEIEKLEQEVTTKSQRLQELDQVSKRLETLVSMKEEQVNAIREELKSTLKESNRSNRLWTIAIGALWFFLGLVVRGFLGF